MVSLTGNHGFIVLVSMVTALLALAVTYYYSVAKRQVGQSPSADGAHNASFFETLFGGATIAACRSVVHWRWSDPETVGKTVIFVIEVSAVFWFRKVLMENNFQVYEKY